MKFRYGFRYKHFVVLLLIVSLLFGALAIIFFYDITPVRVSIISFLILIAAFFHNKKKDSVTGKIVVATVLLIGIWTIVACIMYYSYYEKIPLTASDVLLYLASAILIAATIMIKMNPKYYLVTMQIGLALLLVHEIAAFYPVFYAMLGYGSWEITMVQAFSYMVSMISAVMSIMAFLVFLRGNVVPWDKYETEKNVLISGIEEELINLNSLWQNGRINETNYWKEREALLNRLSRHS